MHHAVCALLIFADTVLLPLGVIHQFPECLHISFAKQITRLLPAENVSSRHAPGGALISLVAGQEVEKQIGLGEGPSPAPVASRKNVAEETPGAIAVEEVLLVRRALVRTPLRTR